MAAATPPLGFEAPFELSRREKIFTLVGVLLGLLLAALDQTIIASAGPAIQRDLQVTASEYPWITTAYLVASTVTVPIYGKLSDLYGRRSILLVGIAIFLCGSFACGISQTTFALIASRALQGLGSAALFTSAFAVLADIFAPAERGKYQGMFGACFALSSVVGPLVGGFLTDTWSWHWVFFVNLPIGAIAVTFILTRMPALRHHRQCLPIDYHGAALLLLCVVPFLVAVSMVRSMSESPTLVKWVVGLIAISGVAFFGFLRAERRAADPLLDLALFRNRVFSTGNLASFILGAAFLSAIVFLPLFLVNVLDMSATAAGLTLTPLTLGIVAGNVISGQLVSRFGHYKRIMLSANVVLISGFSLLSFTLTPQSTQTAITLKMILLGLGLGPSVPLYTLAIQNAVPTRSIGVATAAATFFRQIGSTMGVTLLGVVYAVVLAFGLQQISVPTALEHLSEMPSVTPAASAEVALDEHASGGVGTMHVDIPVYTSAIDRTYPPGSASHRSAMGALMNYSAETKASVTNAIAWVYRGGLLLAVLGLLATLRIPELPLQHARPTSPQTYTEVP